MARTKPVWRRCHLCLERFVADSIPALDKLMELHHINGTGCMGRKQLEMTFRLIDGSWVMK